MCGSMKVCINLPQVRMNLYTELPLVSCPNNLSTVFKRVQVSFGVVTHCLCIFVCERQSTEIHVHKEAYFMQSSYGAMA